MQSTYQYKHLFHFFLLALFILICYSNTFHSEWHFDDIPNIVENPKIRLQDVNLHELAELLDAYSRSRPISYLSFALNYAVSELDTTSYHIVNILIHITSSIFVYLIFLQTLYLLQVKNKYRLKSFSIQDVALLGAALWAVHPIHTQAVTYIVQRIASMAGMFYLIAMYGYLAFRLGSYKGKYLFLFLSGLSWSCGILTKENVILLPIILIGFEFAFFNASLHRKRNLIIIVAVFGLLACLAYFATSGNFIEIVNHSYSYRPFTLWQRIITEPLILFRYLFLLLCPLADFLVLDPDLQASAGLFRPFSTFIAFLFSIILILLSIIYLRKFPVLCFALLYFFLNHAIESSFIGLELYFEHRNYLPSVFIYFAVAYYFIRLAEFYKNKEKRYIQVLLCAAMTLVLTSEANATFLRNDIWKTKISLLEDNIIKSPLNLRSWFTLGAVHIGNKNFSEAEYFLAEAEKLYLRYPDRYQDNWASLLYYNIGILALHTDRPIKAIENLGKSIEINPDSIKWSSHFNLGVLYFENGQFEKSEEALRNALKRGRNLPDIYNVLGRVLYENNKIDEAIGVFKKGQAIEYMPELTLNLIAAYIKQGDLRKAKQALFSIPYNKDDLAYLLYRAYLYTGEERENSLNLIAEKFFLANSDMYSWIDEIGAKKFAAIIYPDIKLLRENLIWQYEEMVENEIESKYKALNELSCQE